MSMDIPPKPLPEPPPKKSGCTAGAILIGCVGVLFVGVLLCGGVGFFGYQWVMEKANAFADKYVAQGYEKQQGQAIQVNQSPAQKTVYICQVLDITKDVDVDIAIACQIAEVKANIHGDVDFLGQVLNIHEGVVIDGDLRVDAAQVVEIHGEVKGKITGNYSVLNYKGKQYAGGTSPSDESDTGKSESSEPSSTSTPEQEPAKAEKSNDEKPFGDKTADEKPAAEKPNEEKSTDEKPNEDKPSEDKPAAEAAPAGESNPLRDN